MSKGHSKPRPPGSPSGKPSLEEQAVAAVAANDAKTAAPAAQVEQAKKAADAKAGKRPSAAGLVLSAAEANLVILGMSALSKLGHELEVTMAIAALVNKAGPFVQQHQELLRRKVEEHG